MALTITNGYVINLTDYLVFDQIVNFLTQSGNKIALLAKGTKKIASKNARNLTIGNFNEIEYFKARQKEKIGRLKKTVIIHQIPWEFHEYHSFNLINEYANKVLYSSKQVFALYESTINLLINKKTKDWLITATILVQLLKINGINFNYEKCQDCRVNETYVIDKNMLWGYCQNCYIHQPTSAYWINPVVLKMLNHLSNKQYPKPIYVINSEILFLQFLKFLVEKNLGITLNSLKRFEWNQEINQASESTNFMKIINSYRK
ncbi:DNA repair protein RecO [[Mycoplasma] testudinis]|uniref:DNA repair protein RecO n=1 Tax=[Mycoplasma] testudinis TaxID=33924 RepID=UPI000488EA5C|nr:DNA repair protein RecO [[Mycoplasma] testudinis]